jgi:hypothetical protein
LLVRLTASRSHALKTSKVHILQRIGETLEIIDRSVETAALRFLVFVRVVGELGKVGRSLGVDLRSLSIQLRSGRS